MWWTVVKSNQNRQFHLKWWILSYNINHISEKPSNDWRLWHWRPQLIALFNVENEVYRLAVLVFQTQKSRIALFSTLISPPFSLTQNSELLTSHKSRLSMSNLHGLNILKRSVLCIRALCLRKKFKLDLINGIYAVLWWAKREKSLCGIAFDLQHSKKAHIEHRRTKRINQQSKSLRHAKRMNQKVHNSNFFWRRIE